MVLNRYALSNSVPARFLSPMPERSKRQRCFDEPLRRPSPPGVSPRRAVRSVSSSWLPALRLSRSAVGLSFGDWLGPPCGLLGLFIVSSSAFRRKKRALSRTRMACNLRLEGEKVTMKTRMAYTIFALAIAGACHRGSDSVKRTDQQYQVVQEGSTNGGTTTLDGSTTPLVATNTAVDTTTNFTLPTTTDGSTPPVSLGETLPANVPGYPLGGGSAAAPAPRPMTRPAVQPRPQPAPANPPMTSSTTRPPATETIATDTTATQQPTTTDTATTAAPAPKKEEKKPEVQPQPQPQPEPQPEPQPPPTQTDTSGAQ
jgi:hypothetical protein